MEYTAWERRHKNLHQVSFPCRKNAVRAKQLLLPGLDRIVLAICLM